MEHDDIRNQINRGRYQPVLEYPRTPPKPHLKAKHTSEDVKLYMHKLNKWEHDIELHKQKLTEYRASVNRLEDTFKRDALKYCGITGHPKADRAFQMAKDNSSGNHLSILDNLEELSDLLV